MVRPVSQDLSVAGKRAGLAGERSGLFMEQIRIIKEMREHDRSTGRPDELLRPRYMVWENVPGAFSSNGGKDFAAVIEETIRIVEPNIPDLSEIEKIGGVGYQTKEDGQSLDASTMKWESGALLGEYMMPSFGECPREENVSRLSQILEDSAPQRYYLSAKACAGILNRAERRGKELPEILKMALENQMNDNRDDLP